MSIFGVKFALAQRLLDIVAFLGDFFALKYFLKIYFRTYLVLPRSELSRLSSHFNYKLIKTLNHFRVKLDVIYA